tara:strand:- start:2273 stop:2416 length:144 start_codon:yes stop_codon:yes gene_type:complete
VTVPVSDNPKELSFLIKAAPLSLKIISLIGLNKPLIIGETGLIMKFY